MNDNNAVSTEVDGPVDAIVNETVVEVTTVDGSAQVSAENSNDLPESFVGTHIADADSARILEDEEVEGSKRKAGELGELDELDEENEVGDVKRGKTEDNDDEDGEGPLEVLDDVGGPPPIPASKEGTNFFNDADVLSGRGGGTNVHPGNRNFRDLINLHRRAYLKARKNDKPTISRAIVRSIRENNGKFLKKDEKTGLWFEIGDDAAREKTSQALRQRAPEMRKLLFDTEREEARSMAEEHMRQQRMFMQMNGQGSGNGDANNNMPPMPNMMNPAILAMAQQQKGQGSEAYSQMFNAAMMGQGMNRFAAGNAV